MCRTCDKYRATILQQELEIAKLQREIHDARYPLTVLVEFEDDVIDLAQERDKRRPQPAA